MTTRLSDNERALLSAYRDGEASSAETAEAERLLADSAEAREYLADLRSLAAFSHVAFPAAPVAGVGASAGFGGKLTSGAIQSAAHSAAHTGLGLGWGVGLAAAAVTTVAVLSATLGGGSEPRESRPVAASVRSDVPLRPLGLDVDEDAVIVPAITRQELVDFAMTGQLPIDSARERFLTVAPRKGGMEIKVHNAPSAIPAGLDGLNLGSVPGLDSLERAIRTSLLQSEGKGIAVRVDLPSLRLRVLEELQELADGMPASLDGARQELDREYQRLSSELRSSRLEQHRSGGSRQVRFVVISGADLPNPSAASAAVTFTSGDRRLQSVEVSSADLGTLAALVDAPAAPAAPAEVRSVESRARIAATAPGRVFIRRSVPSARESAARGNAATIIVHGDSATVTFERIRELQQMNQTLDGVFNISEDWILEAQDILQKADSIRARIREARMRFEQTPDGVTPNRAIENPDAADRKDADSTDVDPADSDH
jgi:hypothetical protein